MLTQVAVHDSPETTEVCRHRRTVTAFTRLCLRVWSTQSLLLLAWTNEMSAWLLDLRDCIEELPSMHDAWTDPRATARAAFKVASIRRDASGIVRLYRTRDTSEPPMRVMSAIYAMSQIAGLESYVERLRERPEHAFDNRDVLLYQANYLIRRGGVRADKISRFWRDRAPQVYEALSRIPLREQIQADLPAANIAGLALKDVVLAIEPLDADKTATITEYLSVVGFYAYLRRFGFELFRPN